MHELSLMTGVMETIGESARANNINKVKNVKLVIGKLTQALPDSLQFAFSVLCSEDELFSGAALEIEERDIRCICEECSQEFVVEDGYSFVCDNCQSLKVSIISGRELYIDYFEGDVFGGPS